VVLAACGLLVSGCYQYVPIQGEPEQNGGIVRVSLTERGSVELAPYIGPTIVKVDGRLTSASDSALTLHLVNAIARNGVETPWTGESVVVPKGYVSRLELRRLDSRRSWIAATGIVVATVALGRGFTLLGGKSGGKTGGTGGPR
jgi:hypothetical protein